MEVVRVFFWLPLIFIASYLAVGALMAFAAAFWPYLIAGAAVLVGMAARTDSSQVRRYLAGQVPWRLISRPSGTVESR